MITTLFGFRGPMSRGEWWLYSFFGSMPLTWNSFFLSKAGILVPLVVESCLHAIGTWIFLAGTAKRLRGRGANPWLAVVGLIPLLGNVWAIAICSHNPGAKIRVEFIGIGALAGFGLGYAVMAVLSMTTTMSDTGSGLVAGLLTTFGAVTGAVIGVLASACAKASTTKAAGGGSA
jgi:hypothetical protein